MKTCCGTSVTDETLAAYRFWSIPHLPVVQKTKTKRGSVSGGTAVIHFCVSSTTLLGKTDQRSLASLWFLYLFLPHRDTSKRPSRHKISYKTFNALLPRHWDLVINTLSHHVVLSVLPSPLKKPTDEWVWLHHNLITGHNQVMVIIWFGSFRCTCLM